MTLLAFLVALALLIAVHEYGHYRVALACGVRVLRFSIGFGKPLLRWQSGASGTEWVIAAIPLGGFVKMLDEREAPVDPSLRHLAFNTQALHRRAAIVAAGPLANLLLAVVLYSVVHWIGVDQPAAILAPPPAVSVARQAGLIGGEHVLRAGTEGASPNAVASFEDLRWLLTRAALDGQDVTLEVAVPQTGRERTVLLPLSGLVVTEVDARLFDQIGITGPLTLPVMGDILPDGAAARAGLQSGDHVQQVDDTVITDGQQLRQLIRTSVSAASSALSGIVPRQTWTVLRQGNVLRLMVTPAVVTEGDRTVGRIGAYIGSPPQTVLVRYGVFDGVWRAAIRTWGMSVLTLQMMGKMLTGQVSVKQISGPLTIADYAGKSADMGLTPYLVFLAVISVSLGVLNLLPLPVLDGGHLMYYLWEGITGKPVSDRWLERLQQGGIAVLAAMMSIAIYNDIARLFG